MTEIDAEVVCGDWEIGNKPFSTSGEDYNVVMKIKEIKRHPEYDISRGTGNTQYVINDIAAIIVEDDVYQDIFERNQIYPACLPLGQTSSFGIPAVHSGWSTPPSLKFLFEFAPPYVAVNEDFIKQWHYWMEISECRDPLIDAVLGGNLTFPSSTFYPPGVICAKEFLRLFCPTSGESGSPLMVKNSDDKYEAQGILSFIKGCDVFAFGVGNSKGNRYILNQQATNPLAYTKLSCFLPWIADQYNLEFIPGENTGDPSCSEGTGDNDDVTDPICTSSPNNLLEAVEGIELPCLFPYYFDGQLVTECTQFDLGGLNSPTFVCPLRNITTKIDGINSFNSSILTNLLSIGLCQDAQQPNEVLPPVNPDNSGCTSSQRRVPFSRCKNNCLGGKQAENGLQSRSFENGNHGLSRMIKD